MKKSEFHAFEWYKQNKKKRKKPSKHTTRKVKEMIGATGTCDSKSVCCFHHKCHFLSAYLGWHIFNRQQWAARMAKKHSRKKKKWNSLCIRIILPTDCALSSQNWKKIRSAPTASARSRSYKSVFLFLFFFSSCFRKKERRTDALIYYWRNAKE